MNVLKGAPVPSDCPLDDLTGFVDAFDGASVLSGWVINRRDPGAAVHLFPAGSESLVGHVEQRIYRHDLTKHGDGRFGFKVHLTQDVTPLQVLAGAGAIHARSSETLDLRLPLERSLRTRLLLETLDEVCIQLSRCQKSVLERQVECRYHSSQPAATAALSCLTPLKSLDQRREGPPSIASVYLPVGLRSGCATTELGMDGHLFLIGGTNKVAKGYDLGKSETDDLTGQWLELLRRRRRRLEESGITYIQLIIPEKQTVLGRFPGHVPTPSPLLQQLEAAIDMDPVLRNSYLSALACFKGTNTSMVFRRVDSHLSPFGSRALYAAIASLLGHESTEIRFRSSDRVATGDLARRFFGLDLFEVVSEVEEEEYVSSRVIVASHKPTDRHIGRSYRWQNPRASAARRVLAFGNSFMDDARVQESVSYWLAGYFRDYEFRFSPAIETTAIDDFRPEIVIAQTIERYLQVVPHA